MPLNNPPYVGKWTASPPASGTNNTGKAYTITALLRCTGGTQTVTCGGVTLLTLSGYTGYYTTTFKVPKGASYSIVADGGIITSAILS